MKAICFYHAADFDGIGSGYLVLSRCLRNQIDVEMIGVNYGDPVPDKVLVPGAYDVVYIVDFSWKMAEMAKIAAANKVVWIDHHRTAIADYQKEPFDTEGILLDEKHSAAMLVWKYLHGNNPPPKIVQAIEAWDIKKWDDISEEEATAAHFYLRLHNVHINSGDEWIDLFCPHHWKYMIQEGELIAKWERQGQALRATHSHRVLWEGMYWMVQIGQTIPVEVMWEKNPGEYVGLIGVNFIKDSWTISLRRVPGQTLDLGLIAKKYGGGGHPGAAGFKVSELPKELFVPA